MKLIVTLMMCSFFLGLFPPVFAGEGDIDLMIEGKVLSARLREIPLKIILEKLEREKGIWFRGNSSVLEEEITVEFSKLPFEEGVNRLLASMNYSLMFDASEQLVGVIIIGKGTVNHGGSEGRHSDQNRPVPLPGTNEQVDFSRSVILTGDNPPQVTSEGRKDFTVIRDFSPPDSSSKFSGEEPENFKVIRNLGPPGGSVQVTAEEREAFTVIRNCPPPGGSTNVTPKEHEEFRVMRNLPPPGGPFEVSPEELENFKVIRNCPPPGS